MFSSGSFRWVYWLGFMATSIFVLAACDPTPHTPGQPLAAIPASIWGITDEREATTAGFVPFYTVTTTSLPSDSPLAPVRED